MAPAVYKVSVPGNLMLMGEHAVLTGHLALVAAIDRKLYATLTLRNDRKVILCTAGVENYESALEELNYHSFYRYAIEAIRYFSARLSLGFEINFVSELGEIGLGSSAAVTAATLVLLYRLLDIPWTKEQLLNVGRKIILNLNGVGSGADLAASIYGGVITYQLTSDLCFAQVERIADRIPLTVIYSGSKVPTPKVIAAVKDWGKNHPEELSAAFVQIDRLIQEARAAVYTQNWLKLGKLMDQHEEVQEKLNLATPRIKKLLSILRAQSELFGAKISGSGLGDCVIALGEVSRSLPELVQFLDPQVVQLKLGVSYEGICYV